MGSGPSIAASLGGDGEHERSGISNPSPRAIHESLRKALGEFVAGLDPDQRRRALHSFDDDERFDLRLAPMGLEGLRIDETSDLQWRALASMLGTVLSPAGLEKMNTIRSLEREVAESQGGVFGFLTKWMRDTRRYFLTIYGDPGAQGSWALRFDGHHLSLNWTGIPGAPLSMTPLFFGGQPRVVFAHLERAGLRVLADEEVRT